MDPAVVALVVTAVVGAVQGTIAFLTKRSIENVDKAIASLSTKVDALSTTDTKLAIELAELRVRVTHLEFLVNRKAGE
jgi:prefoldin subunit 5